MLVSGPEESAALISRSSRAVAVPRATSLWPTPPPPYGPWPHPSPKQCVQEAAEAIDSGAARDLLARLVERTNRA